MNPKYEIILYWSGDDQGFVAEVPELPGCMAHGESQASALASDNEAIALWIALPRSLGELCRLRGAGAWFMHDVRGNNAVF